jgi:hypothetical protein
MANDLIEIIEKNGKLGVRMSPHPGQRRAWDSNRRFVVVLSGTQGGKTSFGPPWLQREIQARGPGDYMVVTPTFPLLELKALPQFRRLFEDIYALGKYTGSPVRKFTLSSFGQKVLFGDYGRDHKTTVFFGYAAEPESLESATARAAWLDEAGQKKFKLGSWEAILRRLSLARGRVLITTTPYNLGWLKQQLWNRWKAGDPNIDVIHFESIANPLFPREEWEDARGRLPAWKFNMFYRGLFERPAGLIYDVFDEERHKIPRFTIPDHWPRHLGLPGGALLRSTPKLSSKESQASQKRWGVPRGRGNGVGNFGPGACRCARLRSSPSRLVLIESMALTSKTRFMFSTIWKAIWMKSSLTPACSTKTASQPKRLRTRRLSTIWTQSAIFSAG